MKKRNNFISRFDVYKNLAKGDILCIKYKDARKIWLVLKAYKNGFDGLLFGRTYRKIRHKYDHFTSNLVEIEIL